METANLGVAGMMLSVLFILSHVSLGVYGSTKCIQNYQELRASIQNNSENADNLLLAFYPPNRSPAHLLNVYYYIVDHENGQEEDGGNVTHPNFENPNTTADYIFQWVDSSTLLLTEFRLFQALSFEIAGLETGAVDVKISPFCDSNKEVELLNLATVWLKTYTFHSRDTEYFYSLYFDSEKFVVVGNSVRGSTYALVTFEYCATVGSLLIVYTLLILCRYNTFSPLRKTMSDISVPCMVFSLIIFIKDVQSYTKSFRYVSLEWYRSFPIPYVFLVCSLINGFMSILVAVLIGPNFPIPSLLKLLYTNIGFKGRFYHSIVQVVLFFSIASFTVLVTFHFAWVVLAFSAYPVRSLASQAFTLPLLFIAILLYFGIDHIVSSPTLVFKIKERLKRILFTVVISVLTIPFLIALLGVLYYYSQVLIEVNDSENYPIKTVIGGLVPTIVTVLVTWTFRNALKAYITAYEGKGAEGKASDQTHTNVKELQSFSGGKDEDLDGNTVGEETALKQRCKDGNESSEDEDLIPLND